MKIIQWLGGLGLFVELKHGIIRVRGAEILKISHLEPKQCRFGASGSKMAPFWWNKVFFYKNARGEARSLRRGAAVGSGSAWALSALEAHL